MADVKVSPPAAGDRTRDRIDVAPRFTQADVIRLNKLFRGQDAAEVVVSVIGAGLLGETAIVSSFGAESAVLLHLVSRVAPDMPVLFLDTGTQFPETLAYVPTVLRHYGSLLGEPGRANVLISIR